MTAEERTANRYPRPAGMPHCDECPGYLISMPDVLEAARAAAWADRGTLSDFYEQPTTPLVRDYIDTLTAAVRDVERHMIRQARESRGH